MDPLVAANLLLVLVITLPHIFYAYVWFRSDVWHRAFKKDSVEKFLQFSLLMKALQFSTFFYWLVKHKPDGIDPFAISPLHWLTGMSLIVAGQILNAATFRAIGHEGVYYGFKLGHEIPWVTGFPFNVTSHPQYVGSAATVLGVATLLWEQGPSGLGMVAAYWTALYAVTAIKESFL